MFSPFGQLTADQRRSKPAVLHPAWVSLGLLCVLVGIFLLSLTQGSVRLSGSEFVAALLRQESAQTAEVARLHQTIVWDLRLPRAIAALLVGSSLGLSGALLQGMLRNGLASPFLLGISAGSGLAAILIVGLGILNLWLPLGAWLGGMVTITLVYLLARTRTGISVERLILGGVAFSTLFGAVQSMLLDRKSVV